MLNRETLDQKRTVLVTGATRGLGLEIAKKLIADGFCVILTGRSKTSEVSELCCNFPDTALFYAFDLKNTEQIGEFMRQVAAEQGEVYGLVNNAGMGQAELLPTISDDQILDLLTVNLHAAILLAKYASRSMLTMGEGRIVNISSIVAERGFKGLSVYAATKAALVGFTRSLARDLGPAGITVNAILPGYLDTEMSQDLTQAQLDSIKRRSALRNLVNTRDVAESVSFLLSSSAKMITGTELKVDAGFS